MNVDEEISRAIGSSMRIHKARERYTKDRSRLERSKSRLQSTIKSETERITKLIWDRHAARVRRESSGLLFRGRETPLGSWPH